MLLCPGLPAAVQPDQPWSRGARNYQRLGRYLERRPALALALFEASVACPAAYRDAFDVAWRDAQRDAYTWH